MSTVHISPPTAVLAFVRCGAVKSPTCIAFHKQAKTALDLVGRGLIAWVPVRLGNLNTDELWIRFLDTSAPAGH